MKDLSKNSSLLDLFKTSIERIQTLVDSQTVVGEPIKIDKDTTVIPISKTSVGFVVGGGEYSDKSSRRVANHFPMAGSSGCGMSVSPIGFISIYKDEIKFIDIENKTLYQTMVNLVNKIISNIDTSKKEDNNEENDKEK